MVVMIDDGSGGNSFPKKQRGFLSSIHCFCFFFTGSVIVESNESRRTPAGVPGCSNDVPNLFTLSVTATTLIGKGSEGFTFVVDVDGFDEITAGVAIVCSMTFLSSTFSAGLVPSSSSTLFSMGENSTLPIVGGPSCTGFVVRLRENLSMSPVKCGTTGR